MADGDDHQKRVRLSQAERRERLAELVLCRTKLSESEAELLWEVFPEIVSVHYDEVRRHLLRRGLDQADAEDVAQEVFITLHSKLLEGGFPDNVSGMLYHITTGKFLNHVRNEKLDPVSVGLPSSGSEPPRTPPDLDRAMDYRRVAPQMLSLLTDDQREVVVLVLIDRLSHSEASDALGVALGTVKSRLMSAKRRMLDLAEQILPPSQRTTCPSQRTP